MKKPELILWYTDQAKRDLENMPQLIAHAHITNNLNRLTMHVLPRSNRVRIARLG